MAAKKSTSSSWDKAKEVERQLKRQAVIDAAAPLFNQRGFAGTSLVDIASQLGITKTALYHYVRDKDELLGLCYQHALDVMKSAYDHAESHTGRGVEKMELFLRTYTAGDELPAILQEIDSIADPQQRNMIRQQAHEAEARFEAFIQQGIAEGDIADCDAKLTASWILGAFSWLPYWRSQNQDTTLPEICSSFITLAQNGLSPR